jgi:ankyrin repeat protein
MTIGAIKEKVAADVGISVDQQVFVFGGQGLPNDQTLSHNNLLVKKVEGHPFEIPTILLLENSMITAFENNDMATIGAYLDAIALSSTFADDDGASYIDIAAHAGLASLVSVLVDRGCVSEGTVKGGWTAVHFASSLGNTEVLTVLLSRDFDKDKPDKASICTIKIIFVYVFLFSLKLYISLILILSNIIIKISKIYQLKIMGTYLTSISSCCSIEYRDTFDHLSSTF